MYLIRLGVTAFDEDSNRIRGASHLVFHSIDAPVARYLVQHSTAQQRTAGGRPWEVGGRAMRDGLGEVVQAGGPLGRLVRCA